MEMKAENKETKTGTTSLGYNNLPNSNRNSSSSSSPPQNSHHNYNLYPPPHLASSQRPIITDPDPTVTTTATNTSTTPITPQPQQTITTTTTKICYRECLKNHAASMGSHVVDGCGEFMPSGEEGTPESFKCAACDCHRNFHRKHVQQQHVPNPNYHLNFPTPSSSNRFSHVLTTPTNSSGQVQPLMMTFGGAAESSSEDLNMFQCNAGAQFSLQAQPVSKKRMRTKFSQEQKDKMMEFAEKVGWKIQKTDEQEVQQFCSQVGIKRQVFKVWMHNNKQAMKKNQM
ncbi:zinc-finger homeodomain protein 6 [Cicer arietinum]|uniref:Zinc-finger homeodomain protein 6-like n=1 Tax=Cicer arietinum TaxID=3827 RepID=A0A1S2YYQ9_CICAR|nr:zinc-finger homeodomain protein 6-like [Cicer arietinum]